MARDFAATAPPGFLRQAGLGSQRSRTRARPTPVLTTKEALADDWHLHSPVSATSNGSSGLLRSMRSAPSLTPTGRTTMGQPCSPSQRRGRPGSVGPPAPADRDRPTQSLGSAPRRIQHASCSPPCAPMAGRMMPTPKGQPEDLSLQPVVKQLSTMGSARPPQPPQPFRLKRQDTGSLSQASSQRPCVGEVEGQALRRRVYFCPTPKNSTHAVTPYGVKYGKHPSFFDFNRRGEMQLTDAGVSDEMKKDEEEKAKEESAKSELLGDSPADKLGTG